MSRHAAAHQRIRRELDEERAAALVRISRTLESAIARLRQMRDRAAEGGAGGGERAAYRELRERARKYRWYLEVQREALGLRDHGRLDEFYEIPPPELDP